MTNRTIELLVRPVADARFAVGCDVGRYDHAERRFDRPPPCKRFAALFLGVAGGAIGEYRQITAVFDLLELLLIGGRSGRLRRYEH